MKNMNKTLLYIYLFCFIIQLTQCKIKHTCQHEELDHDIIQDEHTEDKRRHLQSSSYNNLRVTFDYSELDDLPSDKRGFQTVLRDQAAVAAKFFSNNLKVKQLRGNNIYPSRYDYCFNKRVSSSDKSRGISNSDLHIYITTTNEPSKSYVAYATPCVQQGGDSRPVFGLVNYNIGYLKLKNFEQDDYFEYVLEITLHELTHVLAFSSSTMNTWVDPRTGSRYRNSPTQTITNSNGVKETWVVTDKVKAFARKHYNCNSMPGQKLENQGGSGSAGSHWEKVMIENEFMTASVIKHDAIYSEFTFALLEDSGWYKPTYNNIDPVEWGKDTGCKFLTSCWTSSFREFQPQQVNVCNFHHNSVAKVTSFHRFGDKCMIPSVVSQRICIEPEYHNNYIPETQSGEYYGEESACFDSNIQSRQGKPHSRSTVNWYLQEQRCLKFKCDSNENISVYILGEKYTLDKRSNKINITPKGRNSQIEGYVNGPADPYAFCNTYPRPCPNFCSKNGYCMGRKCYCKDGYTGDDCSRRGSGGGSSGGGGGSTTCRSGQYKSGSSCRNCPSGCDQCTSSSSCQDCKSGYYLHKGKCYKDCPSGYYENSSRGNCLPCGDNCARCNNGSSCSQCDSGYTQKSGSGDCQQGCPSNCSKCSSPTKCTTCDPFKVRHSYSSNNVQCLTKCPDGYYSNSVSHCKKCKSGCKKCSSYSKCLDEEPDSGCRSGQVEYKGKCYSSCPSSYYNYNGVCYKCNSSCKTCSDNRSCDRCHSGYSISSSTSLCVKNSSGGGGGTPDDPCGEGCSYCASNNKCYRCGPEYLKTYIGNTLYCVSTCPQGYYKSSSSCYKCRAGQNYGGC